MRKLLLLCGLVLSTSAMASNSDSLEVSLNKKQFKKGDTLEITCVIPDFEAKKLNASTLNLWLENLQTNRRWRFRYPFINGEANAFLVVGETVPEGLYAVNMLVQKGFFRLTGVIKNRMKSETSVNYLVVPKNKRTFLDNAEVNDKGEFRLKSTLFEDSAYFVFSPPGKTKRNTMDIKIETQLDSAFVPVMTSTAFIQVGDPAVVATLSRKIDTSKYSLNTDNTDDDGLLPGVVVTSKFKSKMEQYNEEYSRGMFQNPEAIVFDGLENDQIANSVSILRFLEGRIPGLTVVKDQETNVEVARWRDEVAEIYIDEFQMDPADAWFIAPSEIAMIKVYRPPAMLSPFSAAKGAIAIYTKKGNYTSKNSTRHSFIVKGYTPATSGWK